MIFEKEGEKLSADVPYRSAIGSLAYLADTSRPDIAYAVNQLARKMASPNESDWKRAKQVLRYLKSTIGLGIMFRKVSVEMPTLIGYCDSDFAGDETSRSTTGYVILF